MESKFSNVPPRYVKQTVRRRPLIGLRHHELHIGFIGPDDTITDAVNEITNYTQTRNTMSVSYAQTVLDKSIRCSMVYDEDALN